jgi:hypothetical protein
MISGHGDEESIAPMLAYGPVLAASVKEALDRGERLSDFKAKRNPKSYRKFLQYTLLINHAIPLDQLPDIRRS